MQFIDLPREAVNFSVSKKLSADAPAQRQRHLAPKAKKRGSAIKTKIFVY
jgi:hypothetical protein